MVALLLTKENKEHDKNMTLNMLDSNMVVSTGILNTWIASILCDTWMMRIA